MKNEISKEKIKRTINQYNYICLSIQQMKKANERMTSLNVIRDYIIILNDERITKNQNNINCYNLINTICNEVEEYSSENNFVDYYEEETSTAVKKTYYKALKEVSPTMKKISCHDVVFYLNNKELTRYDLINEFYGERESTIELLAYENKCNTKDISIKIQER